MKEIKGIGFTIPSKEDDYIDLESLSSLSDVDIAIFSPNISTIIIMYLQSVRIKVILFFPNHILLE